MLQQNRNKRKRMVHNMESKVSQPYIYEIDDNEKSLNDFETEIKEKGSEKIEDVILNYPTVYVHNWGSPMSYDVYVGETNDIMQRTKQHYAEMNNVASWQYNLRKNNATLYIIGHEHFNKSMTLDIEHHMMLYLMSVENVREVHNQRGNQQNKYFPQHELDNIFQKIWHKLHRLNEDLFPLESKIKQSAIYKASPLHRLTEEQEKAKELIIEKTLKILQSESRGQLIFIEGEAGTGKTVLNSSTFYEMYTSAEEFGLNDLECYLLVNHDEQITVYEQIAEKLGLTDRYGNIVCKPTTFINHHSEAEPVDIVFIDEAHLLLTQGKQSYQGNNQLEDIIKRARVVVVMFDENQILTTEQYWEECLLNEYRDKAKQSDTYIELINQLRISASKETVNWINTFTKDLKIQKIPEDEKRYEIRIFNRPVELETAIKEKAASADSALSRMVATYDWEYNSNSAPQMEGRLSKYWEVMVDSWHRPWNRELQKEMDKKEKRKIKSLAWAEQPQTINEVGSTFTIQGFDLNYVGVILGPSVKYRDGKIILDPKKSYNHKATRNRTMSDGTHKKFGEKLIQNEMRVLMTRGVNGLYIYACDEELRNALIDASK